MQVLRIWFKFVWGCLFSQVFTSGKGVGPMVLVLRLRDCKYRVGEGSGNIDDDHGGKEVIAGLTGSNLADMIAEAASR